MTDRPAIRITHRLRGLADLLDELAEQEGAGVRALPLPDMVAELGEARLRQLAKLALALLYDEEARAVIAEVEQLLDGGSALAAIPLRDREP